MNMPGSQRLSGEAFATERLRNDPDADYATIRREATEAGISLQPIQYGRARKSLGLPPLQRPGSRNVMPRTGTPAEPAAADGPGEAAPADAIATPRRKGSDAFDFLVQELRRDGSLAYAELRDRCAAKGWKIAPIMYGRAKAVLGLVPVKPRGSAKKAAAAAAVAVAAAPRALKQVESVAADRFSRQLEDVRNIEQLVAVVKELDAERRRLRELLDRIVTMIDEALG